jgi:fused signal recognition particle receptor
MGEKSRWSLGAKLKGLFGRSQEAQSDEVVDEVIEAPVEVVETEQVAPVVEIAEEPAAPVVAVEVTPAQPQPKKSLLPRKKKPATPAPVEVGPVEQSEEKPAATAQPDVEDRAQHSTEQISEPVEEEKPEVSEVPQKTVSAVAPAKEKTPSAKLTITEQTWEELEETLLTADFGPEITDELIEVMRANVAKYVTKDSDDFVRLLREAIEDRLNKFDTTLKLSERPAVILVVGVNGVGKTTTIGKVAKYISNAGKSVVVGAADTFRAAAVDQLATWADRAGVEVVKPQIEGQDPSAVAYQTIEKAINDGTEIVIIDTAGRLQTKSGLMDELSKIRRVIEKQAPISEVLLVLDATTGQNGLSQAEAFLEHAGVTGLVLTKLDGSAKGGFVLAVQEKTGIPVKLVGNGEGINDLIGFTPYAFAAQLVS